MGLTRHLSLAERINLPSLPKLSCLQPPPEKERVPTAGDIHRATLQVGWPGTERGCYGCGLESQVTERWEARKERRRREKARATGRCERVQPKRKKHLKRGRPKRKSTT